MFKLECGAVCWGNPHSHYYSVPLRHENNSMKTRKTTKLPKAPGAGPSLEKAQKLSLEKDMVENGTKYLENLA